MLTVLEIQTTLVSLWKLQKKIIRITTLTAFRNLTVPSLVFKKKPRLLLLNEIYKEKNINVYISIAYDISPKTSTSNASVSRIYTIKMQDHQIKFISLMYGQLWQTLHRIQDLHTEVANMEHSPNTCIAYES